jgi:hypothetical protein
VRKVVIQTEPNAGSDLVTRWFVGLLVASSGLFVWSVYKNVAIGIHASDTGTSGAGDQMAWVSFFVSVVGIGAAVVGIVVAVNRRKRRPTDR